MILTKWVSLTFFILLVIIISIYALYRDRNTQMQSELEKHERNLTAQEVIEIYFGYLNMGDDRAWEMMLERENQSTPSLRVRQIEVISIDKATDIERFDWFFAYIVNANDFYEITFWDVLYKDGGNDMIHDWYYIVVRETADSPWLIHSLGKNLP